VCNGFQLIADSLVLFSISSRAWKIADFGLTTEGTSKRERSTRDARGTASYRAPELIREASTYTTKVDIFSLGCVFFELVAGGVKAFVDDFAVREYGLSRFDLEITLAVEYANAKPALCNVINSMLAKIPSSRQSAHDLRNRFARHRRLSLGAVCMEKHKYSQAVTAYEAAVKCNPDTDGQSWKLLGDAYRAANSLEKSLEAYIRALRLGFRDPMIHAALKNVITTARLIEDRGSEPDLLKVVLMEARTSQRFNIAIFVLQAALQTQTNNTALLTELRKAYVESGKAEEAEKIHKHLYALLKTDDSKLGVDITRENISTCKSNTKVKAKKDSRKLSTVVYKLLRLRNDKCE
jgi:tetratricopeptide (TPR) repeat protein